MKKIVIHGVPRSGTTWLGSIFDSHPRVKYVFQPLFSYAFKNFISEESSTDEIQSFYNKLAITDDDFCLQKDAKNRGIVPDFKKHVPPSYLVYKEVRYHNILPNLFEQDKDVFGVFLIRDPVEVLTSWINAPKEFDPSWSIHQEWLTAAKKNKNKPEEYYGYQRWKEAANSFLDLQVKYPNRVHVLNYQNLKSNPKHEIETIFRKFKISLDERVNQFIIQSQSVSHQNPYSVFKKNDMRQKGWRELPTEIVDKIRSDEYENSCLLK
jgi:hypothetical protein